MQFGIWKQIIQKYIQEYLFDVIDLQYIIEVHIKFSAINNHQEINILLCIKKLPSDIKNIFAYTGQTFKSVSSAFVLLLYYTLEVC
jgi:hypothetical protein